MYVIDIITVAIKTIEEKLRKRVADKQEAKWKG